MREKDQWAPVAQKRRRSSPRNATNNDYEKIITEAIAKINNTDRVNADKGACRPLLIFDECEFDVENIIIIDIPTTMG